MKMHTDCLKISLALNILALAACLVLLLVWPLFTGLDLMMRFTEMDRAGVINMDALQKHLPHLASGNIRHDVPLYLAQASLAAEKSNALIGACIAAFNIIMTICFWRSLSKRKDAQ
jgi:hypothetical protein